MEFIKGKTCLNTFEANVNDIELTSRPLKTPIEYRTKKGNIVEVKAHSMKKHLEYAHDWTLKILKLFPLPCHTEKCLYIKFSKT